MGNRLINPFTLYVISFGAVLLVYPLHWSGYYPPLQNSLIFFLLISFLLSLIAAKRFITSPPTYAKASVGRQAPLRSGEGRLIPIVKTSVLHSWQFIVNGATEKIGSDRSYERVPSTGPRQIGLISIFLYAIWMIEFIHAGGVPLFLILTSQSFDYRTFGVPTLHVFLVTFSSFYVSYLFHVFLHSRKQIILIFYLINLLPALLIFNRAMLLMNLSTSLFIYFYSGKSIQQILSVRKLPLWVITFIGLSLFFGLLGTLRVSHQIKQFYVRSLVYEIGKATPSFQESMIPSEFFWGYLYFTSPMANLQLTTSHPEPEISVKNLVQWGTNEVLPDAASKRINAYGGLSKRESPRIAPHLNASTVYAGSFMYGGWYTMGLMTLVLLLFPFLYERSLPAESTYYVTGMAMLNTLYLFLIFDNMLAFSGFSFQLFYPLLFSWMEKRGILQFGSGT